MRRCLGKIIAYFDNINTQGVTECINNNLKVIKRRAYRFMNFYNL
ncbi:MAG: transposase [Moorea sp. SIO3H5]|nr:transposase [Moorena sp. SIO3H5]